ncbi:MAG: hypothetical protein QOD73_897 [Solirubrobacteraceae bacterium]|nr:hypothetical protein [Solirubrobacteraceae bacterium]
MGVAGRVELGAVAALAVVVVEAEHAAQEGQRRDDLAGAPRRGLADEDRRVAQPGGLQPALRGQVEPAVDPRGQRGVRCGGVLRKQELRVVGLVPHRPAVDLAPVVATDRRDELLKLGGARARDVVARAVRGPARDGARHGEQHLPPVRDRARDLRVERAPVVGAGVGRVEARLHARVGVRGHVLPVQDDARRAHAEGRDLVEGLRACGVVRQVDRRLEGHALVLGCRRGRREHGCERADEQGECRDARGHGKGDAGRGGGARLEPARTREGCGAGRRPRRDWWCTVPTAR